eukprot:CAMPEP_0180651670 /NCGR_PEP_ID=MMETSP1037_2-20121125/53026_1 /TAXON_ID=632150 /ORGANISM="Azadinium spinosum, Strain 3D9" /LENGTH=113 /DNA_ID=CAMNT_0022677369 /DNA_START=71 /DNA_END=412 /DNA_ORIENTATION=+
MSATGVALALLAHVISARPLARAIGEGQEPGALLAITMRALDVIDTHAFRAATMLQCSTVVDVFAVRILGPHPGLWASDGGRKHVLVAAPHQHAQEESWETTKRVIAAYRGRA